jgi:hypothetical protein
MDKSLTIEDNTGAPREGYQQVELFGTQLHASACGLYFSSVGIYGNVADSDEARGPGACLVAP